MIIGGSLCFRPHGTYIITASIGSSIHSSLLYALIAVVVLCSLRKAFVADVRRDRLHSSCTNLASVCLFSNFDDNGCIIINHVRRSRLEGRV